jgi:hypothetical protein
MARQTVKTSKTIKDYTVKNLYGYGTVTIPKGSTVSNQTACGPDDSYRFWQDFHIIATKISGFRSSILHHDLRHYGLNIPAEYCVPYYPKG